MNGRDMLQARTISRSIAAVNGVRGFAAVVVDGSGRVDVARARGSRLASAAGLWQRKISCDPQACTA